LKNVILKTVKRGGKIFIPAFALGRVQEIAAALEELHRRGDIGRIPVFVDSPLAGKTTKIFAQNTGELDEEFHKLADVTDPFGHGWVKYVSEQADSVRLNEMKVPAVIVSPSGMCEGGRILHHLRNNISNPRNTVILVGYQAQGTLGRKLADGEKEVLIFGLPVKVKAEILMAHEYSAHADWKELLRHIEGMPARPERIFLVHGEPDAARALAGKISEKFSSKVHIASYGETVEI
jgi:metallo-beta-lactamase family protein